MSRLASISLHMRAYGVTTTKVGKYKISKVVCYFVSRSYEAKILVGSYKVI